ncbi:MAG TPA: CHAD domain-containing protein [Aquabacterium sp.]|uniref:CHAD domain-containing protein n=1 Tax=Aquabacterium sp. TaxID=1872578 RepID=UPI002E360696|nr:CHAD domain-containing protein [Aquabacterium sp.]HEX5371924.1 CHAD domain-containing protein [Aquabacterium sp.]
MSRRPSPSLRRFEAPIADTARHELSAALGSVLKELPEALRGRDPEAVHRLRVATRRARTQLDLFAHCLSKRTRREIRSALRDLRHAAAARRDWDVMLTRVIAQAATMATPSAPSLDGLLSHVLAMQVAAQTLLQREGPAIAQRLQEVLETLPTALRPPRAHRPQTLMDQARPVFTTLLGDLAHACRREPRSPQALHRVRIVIKHLRYALEVFRPRLPAAWRKQLYAQVIEAQEILGQANDSANAAAHLQAISQQLRALPAATRQRLRQAIQPLMAQERSLHRQQAQAFAAWWQRWHDAGGAASFEPWLDQLP